MLLTLVIVSIPLFSMLYITNMNTDNTSSNGVSARYCDTIKLPRLNSTVIAITKYSSVIIIFIMFPSIFPNI